MKSFTNNELPDMTDAYRQMYEGKKKDEDKKDEKKKEPRWQDDDVDGKWYEKSDVDGKISKREKEEKKKNQKEEEVELEGEQLDEISADLALRASKKADIARGKAAHAGDKETAVKKNQQAQRLYAKQAAKRKNESVIKSKKEMVIEDIMSRVYENMKGNSPALNQFKEDYHRGQGEKIQKRTKDWMVKRGEEGSPGLNAMKARTAEHKARRGVKKEEVEEDSLGKSIDEGLGRAIKKGVKIAKRVAKDAGPYDPGGYTSIGSLGNPHLGNEDKRAAERKAGKKKVKEEIEIDESERVAQGAYKRAQELGAKRRRSQGGNRGIGKNERAGYNLSQAASSRNASAETQGGNQTGGGSKSYGYAKNKSNPVKSKSTGDTSQIGHERKRDEKTSTGKSGKKLKTAKYKLTFKQRMDHHSRKAGSRRDPKQNPKHTDNKKD